VIHSEVDNGKNDYTVVFYGDNTFAFVNDYEPKDFTIERFEQSNAMKYMKKKTKRKKQLKKLWRCYLMHQSEP